MLLRLLTFMVGLAALDGTTARAQPVDAGVGDATPSVVEPAGDAPVVLAPAPPAPPPADVNIPSSPLSAADVRGAPVPGAEHGRVDEIDGGDGIGRYILRALLLIPRVPMELLFQPVRGGLYINERYNAIDGVVALFVTDDRKTAIFPTAFVETGFGLNAGVRAQFKDLFGGNEKIKLRGAIGGRLRRIAALEFETNKRSKTPVSAGLELRYETRDKERFYGYGNGELVDSPMPIDPLTTDDATFARFAIEGLRAAPRIGLRFSPTFSATLTGALTRKIYDIAPDENRIDEAFMTDRIPGFTTGTTFLYGELELAWDTRRPGHRWDHRGIYSDGGLAQAFVGRQEGLRDGEIGFYRIGVDLQRFIRLTIGPRTLELRGYGELVTGARDAVPFTELPRLGGPNFLRGYPTDRFRDRVATVAQLTYRWAVSRNLAGSLFSDIGRVHEGLDDLSLDGMRVGFGVALEGYSDTSMFARLELASSIDGGLFVYVSLNPVTDDRQRVERF